MKINCLFLILLVACSSQNKTAPDNTSKLEKAFAQIGRLEFEEAIQTAQTLVSENNKVHFSRESLSGEVSESVVDKDEVIRYFNMFPKMKTAADLACGEAQFVEVVTSKATTIGQKPKRSEIVLKQIQCLDNITRNENVSKTDIELSFRVKGKHKTETVFGIHGTYCENEEERDSFFFDHILKCYSRKLKEKLSAVHQELLLKEREEDAVASSKREKELKAYEDGPASLVDKWCTARNSLNYANNTIAHEKKIQVETGVVNKRTLYEVGNLKLTAERWMADLTQKYIQKTGKKILDSQCNP